MFNLTPTHHRDTYSAISPTKPSLSQAGKTILITGGGSGIGLEIARSFAKASAARIIIIGRRSDVLDASAAKLREEFKTSSTEFIARQGDIGDDSSVTDLWKYLHSQNIFVHVLVLNAADVTFGADTLKMDKGEIMTAFNVNVGGNFIMSAKFVAQALRPEGQQLNLINVSTSTIHLNPGQSFNPYASSKAAFTALIGRVADEHPAEDVQIISFHPGVLYSEGASKHFDKSMIKWDEMALPADFSVWAASPEASWLHGRFVWAHWDVEEMKADPSIMKRLKEETWFLRVGVHGLTSPSMDDYLNN